MKLDRLLKLAEYFEKSAAPDFTAMCKNYGHAITMEAEVGLKSIEYLASSNPKFAASHSLNALRNSFQNILNSSKQMNASLIDISLRDIKAYIGNATFYTSSFNAGTGYDPTTHQGGAGSPAAYMNRIQAYVSTLEKWSEYFSNLNKPKNRHDPSIPPLPRNS